MIASQKLRTVVRRAKRQLQLFELSFARNDAERLRRLHVERSALH